MSIHSTGLGHDEAIGVVGTRRAKEMLDCGTTYLYELIAAGLLESYKEGKSRKITTDSIYARHRRKLQENKAA